MRPRLQPPPPSRLEHVRDEQPKPGCDDHLDIVDAVWTGSRWGRRSMPVLLALCDQCPVREGCWADPEWRAALRGAR